VSPPANVRRRNRWALGLALALLPVATATRAEVRRLQVVGVAPLSPAAGSGSSPRRAAVEAALAEALETVAVELAGGQPLGRGEPGGPGRWVDQLGGDPSRFILRYRVLEDFGERPAPLGSSAAYTVRIEVHVDGTRVAAGLRALGVAVISADEAPAERFRLELRELPSWAAYAALRRHLVERAGARLVVPETFEAGLAVLRVEAPGGAAALLDRLRAAPPEGLVVEPLAVDAGALALRVRVLPPPPGSSTSAD